MWIESSYQFIYSNYDGTNEAMYTTNNSRNAGYRITKNSNRSCKIRLENNDIEQLSDKGIVKGCRD